MGVDRTDYVIYGYRLTKEQVKKHNIKWTEEQFEPYVCGSPRARNLRLIFDQMSGEYMVFGEVIRDSSKHEFLTINPKDLEGSNSERITHTFIEVFGREVWDDCIKHEEPILITFTHYS